ncbi:MAG: amidophosphoribosyltransferase [Planctomycetota bacterium]
MSDSVRLVFDPADLPHGGQHPAAAEPAHSAGGEVIGDEARHHCGVFGVYGCPNAAYLTYLGLYALQHRGEESAGIVVSDGQTMNSKKSLGLISEIFKHEDFERLKGKLAIGHTRYSTTGSNRIVNIQPLVVSYTKGLFALGHNGNLVNARQLRANCEGRGSIFQTSTDSEVIVHLMAQPEFASQGDNLQRVLRQLKGAFSLVMMTLDKLIGVRDPNGFRPLSLGKLNGGYILSSETCAFDLIGATFVRDIKPGEMVTISAQGVESEMIVDERYVRPSSCVFEHVYFARPDSRLFGDNVHMARVTMGRRLAREHPAEADVVIPVPDGGVSAAIGYARESGIPFDMGLIRNHYVGRTFIKPIQSQRSSSADIKLNAVRDVVQGKRVVVVDDSMIRGTTLFKRAALLHSVGAKEIHVRICCPPHRHPCYYGIDFPTKTELIANNKNLEEIRDYLNVASVGYLSVEGMLSALQGNSPEHYCTACFTGEYPTEIVDNMQNKLALEV